MNPETVKLLASIAGIVIGFYAVVTKPLLLLIKSENALTRTELKGEISTLKAEMTAMETRLNQRIDTHLVHR